MSQNFQEKRKKRFVVTLTSHPLVIQSKASQDGSVFFLSGVILFDNLQCLRGEVRL